MMPVRSKLARVLAVAGACLAAVLASTESQGIPKAGRIAVDKIHSDWEWSDAPLDQDTFGTRTTYSFVSLVTLLRQYFTSVETVAEGPLSPELLRKYDVWILKTPTRPYRPDEVAAIVDYVRQGGGIWLVGDHTNIFGMNSYLNQIAEKFGIRFRYDAANSYVRGEGKQLWEREAQTHPTMGSVDKYLFLTSCTLQIDPLRTRRVMTGHGLYVDFPDYSIMTFFGNQKWDAWEPYGTFTQAASARLGGGRVVAYTDSTSLSSFAVQYPGRWQMTVDTIAWLNRSNGSGVLQAALLCAGGALFVLGIVLFRTSGEAWARPAAYWALLGVLLGLASGRVWESSVKPSPRPDVHWNQPRTAFILRDPVALSAYETIGHDESSPRVFDTFFTWFSRSNVLPFVESTLRDAKSYGNAVLLDPQGAGLDRYELEDLAEFVGGGGRVWVLTPSSKAADQILRAAKAKDGWTLKEQPHARPKKARARYRNGGDSLMIPSPNYVMRGMSPILELGDGAVLGSVDCDGGGKVILCSVPMMFSNAEMGATTQIPTRERYSLYKVQWDCVDLLHDGKAKKAPDASK